MPVVQLNANFYKNYKKFAFCCIYFKIGNCLSIKKIADTLTSDGRSIERELAALQDINDHYPKYILTMDIDPIADYDGIKKINVLDWLINK